MVATRIDYSKSVHHDHNCKNFRAHNLKLYSNVDICNSTAKFGGLKYWQIDWHEKYCVSAVLQASQGSFHWKFGHKARTVVLTLTHGMCIPWWIQRVLLVMPKGVKD